MSKYTTRKVGRDSGNGQFIPKSETERRPRTTELETIRYPVKPK
jgi:hypothetical protein